MRMEKLLIAALCFFSLSAKAATRTEKEMSQAACQALSALFVPTLQANGMPQKAPSTMQKLYADDQLAVYGAAQGGYALVAYNDEWPAVLACSPHDFAGVSASLAWYMEAVKQAMAAKVPSEAGLPASYGYESAVQPFVETHWGQTKPYNQLCPANTSGEHYLTGCVATAMAQIMRYHGYPAHGKGTNTYGFTPHGEAGTGYNITVDFSAASYDWKNMLASYKKGYNAQQAKAVSTLMYHCGVSVSMQYSMTFSGAFTREAREAFIKHFGYDEGANICTRDFYSANEWMRLVYGELNARRPIYYTGVDNNAGGHAFVLCGYDAQGRVWVNWGWDGNDDGYYNIALLNPGTLAFSSRQDMVIGISPKKVMEHESHLCMDQPFTVSRAGKNVSINGSNVINRGGAPFVGRVAVVMQKGNKQLLLCSTNITSPIANYDHQSVSSLYTVHSMPTGIEDGVWRVFMGSRDSEDKDWRLVRHWNGNQNNYNSAMVTIRSGRIVNVSQEDDDRWFTTGITAPRAEPSATSATRVYDIEGRLVLTLPHGGYTASTPLPGKGMFIIKQGSHTWKVFR